MPVGQQEEKNQGSESGRGFSEVQRAAAAELERGGVRNRASAVVL